MIRFRSVHLVDLISNYLSTRGIITDASSVHDADDAEDDSYPLHYITLIEGGKFFSINLSTETVLLESNQRKTIAEDVNYLRNLFT